MEVVLIMFVCWFYVSVNIQIVKCKYVYVYYYLIYLD